MLSAVWTGNGRHSVQLWRGVAVSRMNRIGGVRARAPVVSMFILITLRSKICVFCLLYYSVVLRAAVLAKTIRSVHFRDSVKWTGKWFSADRGANDVLLRCRRVVAVTSSKRPQHVQLSVVRISSVSNAQNTALIPVGERPRYGSCCSYRPRPVLFICNHGEWFRVFFIYK